MELANAGGNDPYIYRLLGEHQVCSAAYGKAYDEYLELRNVIIEEVLIEKAIEDGEVKRLVMLILSRVEHNYRLAKLRDKYNALLVKRIDAEEHLEALKVEPFYKPKNESSRGKDSTSDTKV